jgi:hypothetical protein
MQPKIFLSHTYSDKPVVEPIAIRLLGIFGQENVFYDAWSIQPGDGIITRMNEGLASPDFVFFFVSKASLQSKMVELEWQNSLYASTKGAVRIVPIRVDGSSMPPILMQNVWIDLHTRGIEVAVQQMVNVVQGQNTFTPQHLGFSNLTYRILSTTPEEIIVEVAASHLMEPETMVMIISSNTEDQMRCSHMDGSPCIEAYNEGKVSDGANRFNGFAIARMGGAITPNMPLRIRLEKRSDAPIGIVGIMHRAGHDEWISLPRMA